MSRVNPRNDVWASRDTFWNVERVKKGYKIKEIAELLDLKEKTASAYFTGFLLPDDDVIAKFCDLFGVDFMRGKGEFYRAHVEYKNAHDRTYKVRYAGIPVPAEDTEPVVKKTKADNVGDLVLEMLYGKIPYTDFKILTGQVMSGADILECVYGKVDFETFLKVVKVAKA